MRPFITLLLVTSLMGGMWAYVSFKDSISRPTSIVEVQFAQTPTRLKILRSATLYDGGGLGGPAVEVAIKSKKVLTLNRTVDAQEIIDVELPDVEVGKNTVNVSVNFEDPEAFLADTPPASLYALEVIIQQGNRELTRKTFTTGEPFVVGGDVLFDVPSASANGETSERSKEPHDHAKGRP